MSDNISMILLVWAVFISISHAYFSAKQTELYRWIDEHLRRQLEINKALNGLYSAILEIIGEDVPSKEEKQPSKTA